MTVGEKVGHYDIIAPLGSGGMGTVYRARDPRLNREVAVKLLPANGDKIRFQTEARALAALNHPNIVAIFDIGENYIVTELVEGAPMKAAGVRQAVDFAAQAADGLSAAHSLGIFHRDIKPQNLLVTPEGRVKLIDFGLAKDVARSEDAPTLTADGTVLGTAPYMSPEQVRGQKIDGRSDLFSLGAVLYEQLAGKRPFQGESIAVIMASVLNDEPDDLPDKVPAGLKQIVYRCLAKDKAARFQSAADLGFALRAVGSGSATSLLNSLSTPFSRRRSGWLGWAAAGLLALVATAGWMRTPPAVAPPTTRVIVEAPQELPNSNSVGSAISPDGKRLAYVGMLGGSALIFVRSLDSLESRPIPGTSGAQRPFWSADSRSIGYFAMNKLMRVDLAGGAPQAVCTAGAGRGGAWSRDGVIVFSVGGIGGNILRRVPASGGEPVAITEFDGSRNEDAHYYPQFLPDGKSFLYFRRALDRIRSGVYLGRLDDPARGRNDKLVLETQYRAAFAPAPGGGGHLLYVRGSSLFSQPMDPASGELAGEPALIAEDVLVIGSNAFADFSVSDTGAIAYAAGGPLKRLLSWRDRSGKVIGERIEFIDVAGLVLSPDSRKLAYVRQDEQVGSSVWIHHLERNTTSRLMFDGPANFPAWSPDSRHIAFASRNAIYIMPADGSSPAQKLIDTESPPRPEDWSDEGRHLVFGLRSKDTDNDIWAVPLQEAGKTVAAGKPFAVVRGRTSDIWGTVSPDGKWLAYASSETGRGEVYIQGFPEPHGRWMVSTNGGVPYGWRSDGREFLYRGPDGSLQSVTFLTGESGVRAGPPVELFRTVPLNTQMTADAQRFLTLDPPGDDVRRPIVVLMNWQR